MGPEMILHVPLSDRSFTSPLLIYAGDNHYDPANAKISHVVYKPNPTIPSEVSFLENENLQIQRNQYLGVVNPSSEFVISFTLHPLGSIANWGSILIFSTNINSAYGNHGDRNPGIWFCPNSLTIAFRYFLKNNAQRSFNFGSLSPNVDYNIEIKAICDHIIWYTNDKIEFMLHIPLSDRSFDSPLLIYAGNKYEDPANAKISNVAYKLNPTIPTIPSELSLLENEKLQIQRNYFLGVVKSSSEYVISFTLHPLGTITSWGSILRFSTDSERESNKHGDRSPGIYFCPNSLTIAFRYILKTNVQRSSNFGSLSPNVDYNIEIKAIGDYITWYPDGEEQMRLHVPLSDRSFDLPLVIHAGSNNYNPANAKISNVVYMPYLAPSSV